MPMFDYYCPRCHTLFSFIASAGRPRTPPACPRDGVTPLEWRPATFATPKRRAEGESEPDEPLLEGVDDNQLEGAFASLASEMEGLDESADPHVLGRALRRFGELSGLELGPRLEQMLARLDRGEDPERVEEELDAELGESGEGEDDLSEFFRLRRALRARSRRPRVDPEIYFIDE